jgi:hypothetical protein
MNTKIKAENFSFDTSYSCFHGYDIGPEEKMTSRQRQILTELIYSKVSDSEAVEDWLKQIDSFSYEDAKRSIRELTESRWV